MAAGGSLIGETVNSGNSQSHCSAWLFLPAVAMYGLLVCFMFVGRSAQSQSLCNLSAKKLSHGGNSSLSLATLKSTV